MGRGKWTRWGRGSCEGWSLELGDMIRCQVVRTLDRAGMPAKWRASSNMSEFGEHQTRDEAIERIEADIRERMRRLMENWVVFQARPNRAPRWEFRADPLFDILKATWNRFPCHLFSAN